MVSQAHQYLVNAAAGVAAETKSVVASAQSTINGPYRPPGRIGDPNMSLSTDPRLNSKIRVFLEQAGGAENTQGPSLLKTLTGNSTLAEISVMCKQVDQEVVEFYNNVPLGPPSDKDESVIKVTEKTIRGGSERDMKVHIYHPANGVEKLPCVVYIHGGGMTFLPTFNRVHDRWCRSLAAEGVVVIMPDFANAWTKEKWNPFPAGLNDCAAAVQWAAANRTDLRISKIIVHGESGGGNLSLATSLKANREGWIQEIAGVYCLAPEISNLFGATDEYKLRELPSLVENHGYTLNTFLMAFVGYFYAPQEGDEVNPLAWPYHAALQDLQGLPPHVMLMDELDPLRDEGVRYARRLVEAGVPTQTRVNIGMVHAASLFLRCILPEHHHGVARDIAAFARAL